MKKIWPFALLVGLLASSPPASAKSLGKTLGKKPTSACTKIRRACAEAGYEISIKSRAIWEECARPISEGQNADKLAATPELTSAAKECQAKQNKRQESRARKKVSRLMRGAERGGAATQTGR